MSTLSTTSPADRLLGVLWSSYLVVLPLGHVTGLRNALALLAIVATLWAGPRIALNRLPARRTLLIFTAWACASLAWSYDRGASGSKLRSDWLLPVASFASAFIYCQGDRGAERRTLIIASALSGLTLLALISLFAWLPPSGLDRWIAEEPVTLIARPMPNWYPGVGDASMFALLCLGPLLALWRQARSPLWTGAAAASLLLVLVISQNRNSVVALPLCLLIFFGLGWWGSGRSGARRAREGAAARAQPSHILLVVSGALCVLLVCATLLEVVSRQRLSELHETPPPWGQAALSLALRDPRPRMWLEYIHLGSENPIAGVGFGRTLPSEAYHTRNDARLSSLDLAARSHAHNLFVNIWMQLGLVGLALFVASTIALARYCVTRWREDAAARPWLSGFAVLVSATLVRELTDDFLVFAMASTFWILAGVLLSATSAATDTPSNSG